LIKLVILLGTFILYFAFISIQNSFSLTNNDIERVGLFDDLCKDNPRCNLFPQSTPPQTPLQIESNLTSDTANQTMIDNDRFLTYSNKSLGLEIQYPIWLNKTEQDRGVEFVFPNKNAGANLVNSSIESTSRNNSAMSHLLYLNKSLDNLFILNTSRSDVMGYPTPTILFTYDNDTELYKGMQFWKIKDDHARQFTYFAPADKVFDEFLPTIDRMLKTIKVP
jgi:hypothetical protein